MIIDVRVSTFIETISTATPPVLTEKKAVARFRHYMGTVSGWACCDGEEGSRGLDGQFERPFALLLRSLHGCGWHDER